VTFGAEPRRRPTSASQALTGAVRARRQACEFAGVIVNAGEALDRRGDMNEDDLNE
jgi:hypothetical protein